MHWVYLTLIVLHVLSAVVWVGGMAFLSLVLVPALRRPGLREGAPALLQAVGHRFRLVGWGGMALLVVTGLFNLAYRVGWAGVLRPGAWPPLMALKVALVGLLVLLTALHDVLGPRATGAIARGSPRWRAMASWLGRAGFLLSLAVVVVAVLMVRGVR